MKLFLKNKKVLILAGFIILVGIFLRSYNFSSWLHFELDQARDARVIAWAYENGPSGLPLLGPRAAGSFLRLGPIFYYIEYLGTVFFGNNPPAIASFILFFSILTIPLCYFFFRRYFNKKISLSLMAIFSVSLFFVLYSRFAWNPNLLPFFTILFSYAILRAVDKEEKNNSLWLVVSAVSLAIATQLHFLAFVSLPLVGLIFILWKRPKIKIFAWIMSVILVSFLYSPMIINEIKTGGDNLAEFEKVVFKKSDESDHNIIEKAVRNYEEHSSAYFLMISGQEKGELPKLELTRKTADIKCDKGCRQGSLWGIISLIFVSSGIFLAFKKLRTEKNEKKRDFLVFSAILFIVGFLVFTPLAYDVSPRYFLLTALLPFVFLGLILEFFETGFKWKKYSKLILFSIVAILIASNIFWVTNRFSELARASSENVKIKPDRILKERARVTLEQQLKITDYIKKKYLENKKPIYLESEPFYETAFVYNLMLQGVPVENCDSDDKNVFENGNYFLIYKTDSNFQKDVKKYMPRFRLKEQKEFGTLIVFNIVPKKEAITKTDGEAKAEFNQPTTGPGIPKRYMWNQIFE